MLKSHLVHNLLFYCHTVYYRLYAALPLSMYVHSKKSIDLYTSHIHLKGMHIVYLNCMHVLMRDERRKEERSKQGQTNNKAKKHSTPKAVTFPKKNDMYITHAYLIKLSLYF